jgi:ferredoxin
LIEEKVVLAFLIRFAETLLPGLSRKQEDQMTTIVTDDCQRSRFTECVMVCPVGGFHGDDEMLYIDPDVCINCGACVSVCPVQAIYEDPIPPDKRHWIEINAKRAPRLPLIREKQEPYPGAEERKKQLGFE